ncbi:MAG: hypothetical protein H0X73_04050 [Chthoniobacterales bacterium]|nr:hypothetical protein [Chthoniobacterales bacterium]
MDNPEPSPTRRRASASPEGIIGIGITLAAVGILFLLLGWAQWMRVEHQVAIVFLPLGGLLVAVGGLIATLGHSRKRRWE